MKPENAVCPRKSIKDLKVLYTDETDNFSIASMLWNGNKRIAIRWNGSGDSLGYPQSRGKATWFILPQKVALAFALSIGNAEMEQVIKASTSTPLM